MLMKLKHYLWILVALCSLAGAATACSDDDEVIVPEDTGMITPDEGAVDEVIFGATAESLCYRFNATKAWTAKTDAECWLKVDPTSGDAGDAEFTIRAAENTLDAERRASITIESGDARLVLKVVQNAGAKPAKQLTFVLKVEGVTAHGADLTIEPSDPEQPYIFGVAETAEIDALEGDQLIEALTKDVTMADLAKGVVKIPAQQIEAGSALRPATDYALVALGYDLRTVSSEVAVERFTTLKEEEGANKPEVLLEASYNEEIQKLIFTMKCLSHDAASATNIATEAVGLDALLGEGYTLENVLDPNFEVAHPLDERQLSQLNYEGLALKLGVDDGLEPDMEIACALCVWNHEGERVAKRVDATFRGAHKSKVDLRGDYDEVTKTVSFFMQCLSQDAVYAANLLVESDELDMNLDKGFTMGQIMNPENNNLVRVFTDEELAELNGEGSTFTIDRIVPGLSYSWVLEVKNQGGARSIKRVDVLAGGTTPNPDQGPEVEVTGRYDRERELALFDVVCTSKDASVGSTLIFKKQLLDEFIASIPLEELMRPAIGFAVKMSINDLEAFNGAGIEFFAGVADGFEPKDMISFVVYAKNSANQITIKRQDVLFEKERDVYTGAIEVDFVAEAGDGFGNDTDKSIFVDAHCTTRNAENAAILLTNTPLLDAMLKTGRTLDDILDENRESKNFEAWAYTWVMNMNTDNGTQLWISARPEMQYSLLFEVTNSDSRKVIRRDVETTAAKPVEPSGPSKVHEIDDKMFRTEIWDFEADKEWRFKGDKPIVIDMYATWCGPCKAMAPIMDRLSVDYDGRVNFYKLDVELARKATEKLFYEMNLNPDGSIPFFVFVNDRGEISTHIGTMSEASVRTTLEGLFTKKAVAEPAEMKFAAKQYEKQTYLPCKECGLAPQKLQLTAEPAKSVLADLRSVAPRVEGRRSFLLLN